MSRPVWSGLAVLLKSTRKTPAVRTNSEPTQKSEMSSVPMDCSQHNTSYAQPNTGQSPGEEDGIAENTAAQTWGARDHAIELCVGGGFLGIHFGPGESRTGRHRAHPWPVWLYSQPRGSRLVCAMRGSAAAAAAAAAGYGNRYVHHRFDQHPKSLLPNSHDIQASTRRALHTPRSISRS